MKFLIQEPVKNQNFSLVYRSEDFSFDREPYEGTGFTSIMINDLQLEIDDEGKIIYVWGLCPLIDNQVTDKAPEKYKVNSLVASMENPPVPGISYKLNKDHRWPIYINKKKGWVCLGNPITKDRLLVEFAPKCIATLENEEIIAIWLKPEKLPSLS